MSWHYTHDGRQIGPVEDDEFHRLVQTGVITPATLVWREGLEQWVEYQSAAPVPAAAPPLIAPPVFAPPAILEPSPPPGHQQCLNCQKYFPPDEVIQVAGHHVCAGCKPAFVQKFIEGVPLPRPAGALEYAEFWKRAVAFILDGILVTILTYTIIIPASFIMATATGPGGNTGLGLMIGFQIFINVVSILIQMTYHVYFLYRHAATPGKMVFRLMVVRGDGSRLSLGRCFGRHFSTWITSMTCCIGYLLPLFDDHRRALHDFICDSRVIQKPAFRP